MNAAPRRAGDATMSRVAKVMDVGSGLRVGVVGCL